jgi:hypothetical protein
VTLVVVPFVVLVVEVVRVRNDAPGQQHLEDEQHRQCCYDSPHGRIDSHPSRAVPNPAHLLPLAPTRAIHQQLRPIFVRHRVGLKAAGLAPHLGGNVRMQSRRLPIHAFRMADAVKPTPGQKTILDSLVASYKGWAEKK